MNSIVTLLLSLALWGTVHSVLASHFVKDRIRGAVGNGLMRGYRLLYNGFAALSFLPILYLMSTLSNQLIYRVPVPWSYLMFGGQAFAIAMLFAAFLQTDSLSFIGLRQLFEEEQRGNLVTRGLYRFVRHPLYTFGLLFIWLSPNLSQNLLVINLGATIYILVGTYFEERKLLREFGQSYADYKRATPMLIPGFMFTRNSFGSR